jgi:hypothetical protein
VAHAAGAEHPVAFVTLTVDGDPTLTMGGDNGGVGAVGVQFHGGGLAGKNSAVLWLN